MGDAEEDEPSAGLSSPEARATEQAPTVATDAPASSEPSSPARAGQQSQPPQSVAGLPLDQSSELGAGTLSLLFPTARPAPTPPPAPAPRVTRKLAADAALDGDTRQPPVRRAPPTRPLPTLDSENIETRLLRPTHPLHELDTLRLPPTPGGDISDIGTARLSEGSLADIETARLSESLEEIETSRLPPKSAATGAGAALRPPPRSVVPDLNTLQLPSKSDVLDADTFRLAPAPPPPRTSAEWSWPSARGVAGADPTLPRAITPETPMLPYAPGWSQDDIAALDDALDRESSAALAALAEMAEAEYPDLDAALPSRVPLPRPTLPPMPALPLTLDEPPDETQIVVWALRQDISTRESPARRVVAALTRPAVIIMTLFVVAQAAALSLWSARLAPGEIASLDAGLRVVQGYDLSQGARALAHVMATLLWLGVASVGYQLGGLAGARVVAIVCVAVAGLATAAAAKNLFGSVAGLFTASMFALSGPVIYLAHLAVPDQLALVGTAVSLWAITQATASRRNGWLFVAACAISVGVIAWSPALLGLISLLGVALALRGRPSYTSLYIAALVVVAIIVSRVFPAPESALAIIPHRSHAGLSLSLSVSALSIETLCDGLVVWALAIAGWVVARRWKGGQAAALVAGMLIWPAYVALAGDGANIERRLVFGFVFGLPLAGAAFTALQSATARSNALRWARVAVLLLVIAVTGVAQAWAYNGWSGPITPHAIHVVVGKADVGAPATPPASYAASHRSGAIFTRRQ